MKRGFSRGQKGKGYEHAPWRPLRKAPKRVVFADAMARNIITFGGILVLLAVMGILVFLILEVRPLFLGAKVEAIKRYSSLEGFLPALLSLDESGSIAYGVTEEGSAFAFHTPTGRLLTYSLWDLDQRKPTSFAFSQTKEKLALGFSDGTVRVGNLRVVPSVKEKEEVPTEDMEWISVGDALHGGAFYRRLSTGEFLKLELRGQLTEAKRMSENCLPIKAIHLKTGGTEDRPLTVIVTMDEGFNLQIEKREARKNLFTGKEIETVDRREIVLPPGNWNNSHILIGARGENLMIIDASGRVLRYEPFSGASPKLLEETKLLPDEIGVGAAAFLSGDRALVAGFRDGAVRIYFLVEDPSGKTQDGRKIVLAKELETQRGAIVSIDVASRGKIFATADETGEIWVRHSTSEKTLARFSLEASGKMSFTLAPRTDGLLALANGRGVFLSMKAPHPETSWKTLFGKVWYEGHPSPEYVWQSTGGTEDFEPKLSLVPLMFGTMKGTFYSLIVAVPIAILAAIFTSEFLGAAVRGKVKPMMEVMASLPSVILGFVAALVLAPFVEIWILSVVLVFLTVPMSLILGGYAFQVLPHHVRAKWDGPPKVLLIGFAFVGGIALAIKISPLLEKAFFGGDFKGWLAGGTGRSGPFTAMILLPGILLATWALMERFSVLGNDTKGLAVVKGVVLLSVAFFGTFFLGEALERLGVDPRKGLVGTYAQRNALIVAFAMGFAVIPIIYSLAEEALRAVPDHLRAASLACGATRWQTVLWVVLPTAASGIFTAIMIGMGRAVGETMIVVMATGNTPIMDINIFNGFRALSANIAVELPEAVKGGTLYRVLFLTALVLFSMTFLINTVAEVVRQRFRKRSAQL